MSNVMISLLFTVGVSGWLYFKFAKRSGTGNSGPAAIGAAVSGVIIFIVVLVTLNMFIKK